MTAQKSLERQKQFLVDAINDAKKAELGRLKQIDLIKDVGLRQKQMKRYEFDRMKTQERIADLSDEYEAMQAKMASGELQAVKDAHRRAAAADGSSESGGFKELKNRFAGFETRDKMVSKWTLGISDRGLLLIIMRYCA